MQTGRDVVCAALEQCRGACIGIAAAFVCALLMLSKTAMNLKSHVKDDAWMRRVRRILLKLQVRSCSDDPCCILSQAIVRYPWAS